MEEEEWQGRWKAFLRWITSAKKYKKGRGCCVISFCAVGCEWGRGVNIVYCSVGLSIRFRKVRNAIVISLLIPFSYTIYTLIGDSWVTPPFYFKTAFFEYLFDTPFF